MKTAEETLSTVTCNGCREITEERALQAMKEYALEACKEALRLASENAKTEHGYFSDGSTAPVRVVDKHSILSETNIPKELI